MWRRWGLRFNREHGRGRKQGMQVVHDDGCGRVVERVYLRPDREYGWWVQVTGRKWTDQHHPAQQLTLRCHLQACGWQSRPIPNDELVAMIANAATAGRRRLYTSVDPLEPSDGDARY